MFEVTLRTTMERDVLTENPLQIADAEAGVPMRRGERRKQLTKRRLLDAAAEIYAKVGVEGATISAITEQADVGLGTFYLHFADKDAIALAVCNVIVNRVLNDEKASVEDVKSVGGDPDPLAIFSRVMCARAAESPGLFCALLRWEGPRGDAAAGTSHERNELRRSLIEPLGERFRNGMNSGRYRTEDPLLAASAALGVFGNCIPAWVASGRTDWNALGTFIERTIVSMFRR
jgi:AcrR family transcriptional regulator